MDALQSDDSFTEKDEQKIGYKYCHELTDEEQKIVDYFFIRLCGYSLKSLLIKARYL